MVDVPQMRLIAAKRVHRTVGSGDGSERVLPGFARWSRFLEFDEERDGIGRADVLPRMHLGAEPADLTRRDGHLDALAVMVESAVEGGGGDHHTVGVLVRLCLVAGVIVVAQDPDRWFSNATE